MTTPTITRDESGAVTIVTVGKMSAPIGHPQIHDWLTAGEITQQDLATIPPAAIEVQRRQVLAAIDAWETTARSAGIPVTIEGQQFTMAASREDVDTMQRLNTLLSLNADLTHVALYPVEVESVTAERQAVIAALAEYATGAATIEAVAIGSRRAALAASTTQALDAIAAGLSAVS